MKEEDQKLPARVTLGDCQEALNLIVKTMKKLKQRMSNPNLMHNENILLNALETQMTVNYLLITYMMNTKEDFGETI